MTRLVHVTLLRLEAPLTTPYHWSHGALAHFDLVFAVARDETGRTGIGETAPVTGYGHETLGGAWGSVRAWAHSVVGLDLPSALSACEAHAAEEPFAATALVQALECLHDGEPQPSGTVPLAGTVNVAPGASSTATVERLVDAGHEVLKLKVGFDAGADLRRIREAAAAAGGRARLRLDANQGYSPRDARALLDAVAELPIELVEQPLPASSWQEARALHRASPVPLMLDEAIVVEDDIERAAECATYVKFKLMKSGGARRLRAHVALAESLGLGVVIGNGVVSGYGAYAEALVHRAAGLATAGEMNGYAKLDEDVLVEPLVEHRGGIVVGTGVTVDMPRLRRRAREVTEVGAALPSRIHGSG